ncbi:hypothetical protein FHR32_007742 [Streptosporangium album]|uniref:F5/8 type C domain-containing protein n=1 Tax=Streptosporangium album TaxID=47479 RepID=A0A7W7S4H4_9ACTN|nr:family 43 glycosylhydrolase [Streptosporangium album]MBB4943342.1 hypothetical protein [Streptosporangium album]
MHALQATATVCAALVLAAGFAVTWSQPALADVTASVTNFAADGRQQVRFDTAGDAVDAHDGQIAQFGDAYYLYGTSYDCGYQWKVNSDFCGFKVYSSPDLTNWTDRGYVVPPRDCTYCFRPHVVFNRATGRYVMWVNDQDALDNFRVFTSDRPTGPFTEQPVPDLPSTTPCTADLGLFVDHDNAGYLTCSNAGWHVAVLRLSADYLQPTDTYSVLGVTKVEAPALFERNGTYYLTMSDPNCGYCTGTGTAYVSAPTPLGPWTGVDAWTVRDGVLDVAGGLYGLSARSDDWTDYTFSFDTAPMAKTDGVGSQAGWSVRMKTPDKGYLFLLSGSGETAGKLTVLERNGATVNSHAVTLPYPVHPGEWHRVSVTVAGQRITTTLDGVQVDSFTDATYTAGGVGFREWNGANLESARFDNVKVVAADGTVLLADDFSSSDLAQWVPPLAGRKISGDSCGGQPAHVTTLTGADGQPVYLYFSDLWDFHTNEALANYHWEPLRFDAAGTIQPLRCDNSVVALASGHPGHPDPVPGLDQSSESGAFSHACPVTLGARYGQTFTVGRSGPLRSVAVTVFKDGTESGRVLRNPPTGPLDVRLTTLTSDGVPDRTLWSTSIRPERIGWSPRQLVLESGIKVVKGQRLALVLSMGSQQGCYGVERDPGDPYAGGVALSGDDQTLAPVADTDIKFRTVIGAPAAKPVKLKPTATTTVLAPQPGVPVLPGQPTRAVFRVANLTDHAVRVPVEVEAPDGYSAVPETSTIDIGVGETVPVVVAVNRAVTDPDAGDIRVRAGAGSVTAPVTPTENVLRTAVVSASSTYDGWRPSRVNDGQIQAQHSYSLWNGGAGWNDNDKSVFPDTLTATWDAPTRLGSVRVRTLDAPEQPAEQYSVRDFEVRALIGGAWQVVGRVSGNVAGTVDVTFPQVATDALRLVVTGSNDRGYSRIVELEGYTAEPPPSATR